MNCKKCGQLMILENLEATSFNGLYRLVCKNCGNKTIAASRNVYTRIRRQDLVMFIMLAFFVGVVAGYAWRCAQLAGI